MIHGASPEEAAERDVGRPTALTWPRWVEDHVNAQVGEEYRVFFTDELVLDDGRAGAGWVEATGGGCLANQGRAELDRGLGSADLEIAVTHHAIASMEGLLAIFTDSATAIGWLTTDPSPKQRVA